MTAWPAAAPIANADRGPPASPSAPASISLIVEHTEIQTEPNKFEGETSLSLSLE